MPINPFVKIKPMTDAHILRHITSSSSPILTEIIIIMSFLVAKAIGTFDISSHRTKIYANDVSSFPIKFKRGEWEGIMHIRTSHGHNSGYGDGGVASQLTIQSTN